MITYFDSSALVKRYDPNEINAAQILTFFQTQKIVYTSDFTSVEVLSAFRTKERTGEFSKAILNAAISDFKAHSPTDYKLVQTTSNTIMEAERLVLNYKLRAYDAMQVATALTIARAVNIPPIQLEFYTADKDQAVAALTEGFTVISV